MPQLTHKDIDEKEEMLGEQLLTTTLKTDDLRPVRGDKPTGSPAYVTQERVKQNCKALWD